MRVTILGSGGALPVSGRAAPSILVETPSETSFLVDAGPGVSMRLAQIPSAYKNNMTILLTHFHADHVTDLPTILFSCFMIGSTRSLTIVGPPDLRTFFDRFFFANFSYLLSLVEKVRGFTPAIEMIELSPDWQLRIGDTTATAQQVAHAGAQTYGYRFEGGGFTVVFSGDTTFCDGIITLARDADALVQDCAFGDEFGPNPFHAIPSQVARLAETAKVKSVYVYHVMPDFLPKIPQMLDSIRSAFSGGVFAAEDMMEIRPLRK